MAEGTAEDESPAVPPVESNVEKLKREIDRLRHELDLSERRHKQLVPTQTSGPGLPGPLSRYRRRHDRVSEPEVLPVGARIENLEVQ